MVNESMLDVRYRTEMSSVHVRIHSTGFHDAMRTRSRTLLVILSIAITLCAGVGVRTAMCETLAIANDVALPLAAPTVAALEIDEAVEIEATESTIETVVVGEDAVATDSIWLISTRHLGSPCGSLDTIDLDVKRLDDCGNTSPRSLEEFFAVDCPDCTTLIYVHGNRNTYNDSIQYGMKAYRQIVGRCANRRPVRFVIWSWPSSRLQGAVRDARVKACRTNVDGYYLAWFMNQIDPNTPLRLFGFSYGARVITGGLHTLHGGSLFGRSLHDRIDATRSIRVALCAAAVHNDWVCPGHCHGNAFFGVEHLLNVYNDRDPALQRYRVLDRRSRPQALGYTGLPSCGRVCPTTQCNARNSAGRKHEMVRYIYCESTASRLRRVLLDSTL